MSKILGEIEGSRSLLRVLVVQLTGRMHFGAARALEGEGYLQALLTDFHISNRYRVFAKLHPALTRYSICLPPEKVFGNSFVGALYRLNLRLYPKFSPQPHIISSRALAAQMVRILNELKIDTVFSFDIQAVECFRLAHSFGLRCVLEQCVAPRRSQIEMLKRFSSLISLEERSQRTESLEKLIKREEEEWQLADLIVCPSDYVYQELQRWGVPAEKIRVVPYGYDGLNHYKKKDGTSPAILKGVFVGNLDPRKGVQDVLSAAKLIGSAVQFDIYGSGGRNKSWPDIGPGLVNFHGKVSFEKIREAYESADFFILPSYLEGSATVVYEALSYGLPCIVTPQVGSVVTDMVDGFLIDSGNSEAIVNSVRKLDEDRILLSNMSLNAFETSREYTVAKYGKRLCSALSKF